LLSISFTHDKILDFHGQEMFAPGIDLPRLQAPGGERSTALLDAGRGKMA
jgi:hypothetical protein